MKGFCPLASGSKGNSLFLGTEKTKILIDAGISARAVDVRLKEIGVSLDEIEAILITHEHTDHIGGLLALAGKRGIPVLANSDTAKAIYQTLNFVPKFKIFSTGEPFHFGDLEISPFSIQHDAVDPVGFTIRTKNLKLGICTDLGFASTTVKERLQGCDYLYVEANHQPSMVHASARPPIYKQRVLSRQGHLSNEECAQLISAIAHPALKHVYLAHLSSECNSPDLALEIIRKVITPDTSLSIAFQDKISHPIFF